MRHPKNISYIPFSFRRCDSLSRQNCFMFLRSKSSSLYICLYVCQILLNKMVVRKVGFIVAMHDSNRVERTVLSSLLNYFVTTLVRFGPQEFLPKVREASCLVPPPCCLLLRACVTARPYWDSMGSSSFSHEKGTLWSSNGGILLVPPVA